MTFHELFAIGLFSADSMVVFDETTLEIAEKDDDMVCLEIQGITSIRLAGTLTLSVDVDITVPGGARSAVVAGIHTQ